MTNLLILQHDSVIYKGHAQESTNQLSYPKKKNLIMYLVNLRFCFEPLDSYSGLHVASGHQVGHTWICDKVQVLRIQSPPKGSTSEHHCTGDQAFNCRPSGAPWVQTTTQYC